MRVDVKPLSINQAFQGRRFKSKEYKAYEKECLLRLRPFKFPQGPVSMTLIVGYSNKANDIDNAVKPILDILQKKYKFNDKDVYELHIFKVMVKKGQEFWQYDVRPL
jgi:Holliday junction resolvase RusA-like endonuclease